MEPTAEQLARLAAASKGPVVMLNLVKYAQAGGKDAYLRYSRGFVPLLKQCGGTILWAGEVNGVAIGDDEHDAWDYAVLVRYPNAKAFADTMTSEAYAAINPDRLEGLSKHVILPVSETYSKFAG